MKTVYPKVIIGSLSTTSKTNSISFEKNYLYNKHEEIYQIET